ncbi:hypothetical protein, partial [Streptomyces resistomycificus]
MTTTDTPAAAERSSAAGSTAPPESYGAGPRLGRPRGRHRRPRPRKVLLAAGGLALAAGVLSLVRMTPDPGVGGLGAAEAGPSLDPYSDTDAGRSTNAAATVGAETPVAGPSATTPLGGPSASPTPGASLAPTPVRGPAQPSEPAAAVTTVPDAPDPTGASTGLPTPPRPSTSTT